MNYKIIELIAKQERRYKANEDLLLMQDRTDYPRCAELNSRIVEIRNNIQELKKLLNEE